MVTGQDFASQARSGGYIGIPYETLDCQGFVEQVLKDCGIKRNWRGSNDMWRNAVHGHVELEDVEPPMGAWLFTIKHDGKEDTSRYKDGVNAAHVGIYCGNNIVIHSTNGGVQWDKLSSKRWTHYALSNDLQYNDAVDSETLKNMIDNLINSLEVFKNGLD